jgi:predicted dehydrogenase
MMSMRSQGGGVIRVALIGYGRAGRTFHTPLIRSTPGFDLAIVVSSRPAEVHADLPQAAVIAAPADVWTDTSVDLVVIATPTATHGELAAAALDAGKHVVVDKPLATSLDAARRLGAMALRQRLVLATFHNRRWDGDFLAIEEIVRSGALGDVTHVESHFDRYRPLVRDRWRERPGPGSGVWNDLGPHLADQALRLFGLPESISGSLAAHRAGAHTDDWAHVVLGYGGRAVILHASMLAAAGPRFVVHGSRGTWVKVGIDPQEFELSAAIGADLGGAAPVESATLVDGTTRVETSTPIPRGDYRRFYTALRDAIRGEGSNPVPPAEAIAATAVVETAARSAAEGRVLPLPLTAEEREAVGSRPLTAATFRTAAPRTHR